MMYGVIVYITIGLVILFFTRETLKNSGINNVSENRFWSFCEFKNMSYDMFYMTCGKDVHF